MKPVHGLPDLRGSLSASVPSRAIAEANKRVQEEVTRQAGKRGLYAKPSSSQHCEIAKYASQHGTAESARHFLKKLDKRVSESTVKLIKKVYIEALRKRARTDDDQEMGVLPSKKQGRKVLLGQDLDQKVQSDLPEED